MLLEQWVITLMLFARRSIAEFVFVLIESPHRLVTLIFLQANLLINLLVIYLSNQATSLFLAVYSDLAVPFRRLHFHRKRIRVLVWFLWPTSCVRSIGFVERQFIYNSKRTLPLRCLFHWQSVKRFWLSEEEKVRQWNMPECRLVSTRRLNQHFLQSMTGEFRANIDVFKGWQHKSAVPGLCNKLTSQERQKKCLHSYVFLPVKLVF